MPWSYAIDEAARLIRFRFHGPVSDADVLEADQTMRKDPLFRSDLDQLLDMRDAEGTEVTPAGIREITRRPPVFSRESRRALIVSGDLGYGLARVFQARRGEVAGEIRIFRDLGEAEGWLAR